MAVLQWLKPSTDLSVDTEFWHSALFPLPSKVVALKKVCAALAHVNGCIAPLLIVQNGQWTKGLLCWLAVHMFFAPGRR